MEKYINLCNFTGSLNFEGKFLYIFLKNMYVYLLLLLYYEHLDIQGKYTSSSRPEIL